MSRRRGFMRVVRSSAGRCGPPRFDLQRSPVLEPVGEHLKRESLSRGTWYSAA